MLSMKETTEQKIYKNTCIDEYTALVKNMKEENGVIDAGEKKNEAFPKFKMNRLVYSLTYNDMIAGLSKEYHGRGGGTIVGYANDIGLQSYIDVSKIGNHDLTFREAMNIVKDIRESVGGEVFYGAILANNQHVDVNPLHPLVLNQFLRFSDDELVKHNLTNYSVIIYTFNKKFDMIKDAYPEKFIIEDRYTQDILDLILGTKYKREVFTINSDFNIDIEQDKFVMKYNEKLIDKDGKEFEIDMTDTTNKYKQSYIIPGQILNLNGITYPYYGAIYVKGGRAWNLSPMLATNIDNPQKLGAKGYITGSTICTKVGDSRTAKGCMTLNHSNTTSQRNPYTFRDGSMGYAQVAVDIALSMLYEDYDGKAKIQKPEEKLTFIEFKKKYKKETGNEATKKDYINYIKTRLIAVMGESNV